MSPGAVYRYFPSKTDIIAAIAEADQRQADDAFPATMTGPDLIEKLCFFASRFVDLAAESGDAPLVADVMSEALRDRAFAQRLVTAATPFHEHLAAMISSGQESGAFDPELDPKAAARIVMGLLDGLCLRAAVRGDSGTAIASDVRVVLERLLERAPEGRRALPKSVRKGAQKETIP